MKYIIKVPLQRGYNFLGWFAGHHWAIEYNDMIYEISQSGKTKTKGGIMYFNFQKTEEWRQKYRSDTILASTIKIIESSTKTHEEIMVFINTF